MNLFNRLIEIENKDFSKLTEEELVILNYCNTYKEANLYYQLMVSCIDVHMTDLALVYAKKGKVAATQAITLQSRLTLLIAEHKTSDFDAIMKLDSKRLQNNVDGATKTIHLLETRGDTGNILELIPAAAPKKEDNLVAVKAKLAEHGLVVQKDADPKMKANQSLKILDRLLLTGQISQKVYNQKCREVMLNKPKSA